MWALKRQYFLVFAVMGSTLPFMSVFLAGRGLSLTQIGGVLSVSGAAVFVTPVLSSALADLRVRAGRLLALAFAVTAGALLWLASAEGLTWLFAAHALFALALAPASPLQDGLYFEQAQAARQRGASVPPYHRVRWYGTLGFIGPSLLLFGLLYAGVDTAAAVVCGAGCALLGLLNALTLPSPSEHHPPDGLAPDGLAPVERIRRSLPTAEALRILMQPRVGGFALAMLLLHAASGAYYSFYPVYLTREVGLAPAWVGLISNVGVVIELGFMFGFGWLLARLGLRRLVLLGVAAMLLRFGLLAGWPSVTVAVGTQLLHGLMVLVMFVVPPVYLDRHALPTCRHSLQGLYAMLASGIGRVGGTLAAGFLGEALGLPAVFLLAAGLTLLALGLLAVALEPRRPTESLHPHGCGS